MSAPLMERVPPQDLQSEQAVLGSCLMWGEAIDRAEELLRPEDFYSEQLRAIYRVVLAMHGAGRPVDIVSVEAGLRDAGKLDEAGGRSYLADLAAMDVTAAAVESYAHSVQGKARLRELIKLAGTIQERAYGGGPWEETWDPDSLCSYAAEQLLSIGRRKAADFVLFRDAMAFAFEQLSEASDRGEGLLGIDTGLPSLNAYLPGWPKSEYTLLAARPSVGKSAFALQQACEAAAGGAKVAYFSLEMGLSSLVHRYLARALPMELSLVRRARFAGDWAPVARAMAATQEWQLWLCCRSDLSISQLRADCRALGARVGGLDLVVVDYLGLVKPDQTRYQNRVNEVRQVSAGLKAIAQESGAALLALSQLSRQAELDGTWPELRHLRDSGDLEQDADNVLFLHKPRKKDFPRHMPEPEVERALTTLRGLFVAKQRNGPIGRMWLHWHAGYQQFAAVDAYHVDPEEGEE